VLLSAAMTTFVIWAAGLCILAYAIYLLTLAVSRVTEKPPVHARPQFAPPATDLDEKWRRSDERANADF
jgi:hypothetical protein